MSPVIARIDRFSRPAMVAILFSTLIAVTSTVSAGVVGLRNRAVGGISIDPSGAVAEPDLKTRAMLRRRKIELLKDIPDGLNRTVELRKVSLRGLEAAIDDALENNAGVLPDEVKYLAGLQRVEYVLVYPETQDVVLAGPGEGWTVDERGNTVGITTGRPVLLLDDLLVALRSVEAAREIGISCSIDPTPEGVRSFRKYIKGVRQFSPAVAAAAEKALGQQKVTITGVPDTSHFARVLVSADYRMKRIAMNLEKSPVRGLPSYVDMMPRRSRSQNTMPRWWLAGDYDSVARSEDGLAWQVRGHGVKTMTEDDYVAEDGSRTETGKTSSAASRWANLMTDKYEDLSAKETIFGELRNVMDLCVVSALIAKEDLFGRAGCELPLLTSQDGALMLEKMNAPKAVATQCSFTKSGRSWILTASGGVQIDSWQIASRTESAPELKKVHDSATTNSATTNDAKRWWWN